MSRIITIAQRLLKINQPQVGVDPYTTHQPILIGIGVHIPVTQILELGSGLFSTSLFLNRDIYPNVQVVDSYETDSEWIEKISEKIKDIRLNLHFAEGGVHSVISSIPVEDYDLIFIDDSILPELRSKTIQEISLLRHRIKCPVVIHDFERSIYQQSAHLFRHKFRFRSFVPDTGVVWNYNARIAPLKTIKDIVNRYRRKLTLTDLNSWYSVMKSEKS